MKSERLELKKISWQRVAASASFISAILSLAIGFVFTTNRLVKAPLHPLLHDVGLVLLIIGIPLLILGGHFLDLMDRKSDQHKGIKPLHVVISLFGLLCVPGIL
jgi:hypothetical protein